jgi:uncharacterized RDD family membrane protein YckC
MELKYTKSNYGRIVLAGLIDAALIIAFFVFFFNSIAFTPTIKTNPNLSLFTGFILYRLISISIFNSTLGMKVLRLTFLTEDEEILSFKEKLLASIFILFKGVDYYREVRAYI